MIRRLTRFVPLVVLLTTAAMASAQIRTAAKNGQITQAEMDAHHKAHGEGKCGEGKCGEGKCGGDKEKAEKEGKCGEGKCGGSR